MSTKKNADGTKKTATLTRRQGEQVKEWRAVATAIAANAADLPGAAVQLADLLGVIDEVDKLLSEQATLRASKQVATQRLKTLFNQGGKLSTVLKAVARQHYGHGNDKLVEFGIQPLRSRPKPTIVPPTTQAPEVGTPAPVPTTPQPSSK
ncbi:MAG: hypothetical protein QOF89_5611 [Acidobacteriota bacterium]|jgi:hypothetical protein|nr:hypothetical protein [Acidobacteriota bacterium]